MAIQVPKTDVKIPSWINILLYASIILLAVTLLSYAAFSFLIIQGNKSLKVVNDGLVKTQDEMALENEVWGYKEKIDNFAILLKNHLLNSNLFSLFEKVSHPKIWISELDLKSKEGKIEFSGVSDDFKSLGQQLLILEKEDSFRGVNLTNVSFGKKEEIEFTFGSLLNPKLFKK
ncbi:MAG: hypothetical protein PHF44_01665 [Candidatus Pacebacteria bacterium]|nr:hypothetical protein [Candidatus Paceibacterota bacterium]